MRIKKSLILFYMKYLIINADDFGYSKVFNVKILELIQDEFIYFTSVMVNWINDEQPKQVKQLSELVKDSKVSVGLHLEFTDDNFRSEIERQYKKFLDIFKFKPSHIDIHKFKYLEESYSAIRKFCLEKKLPCRNHGFVIDGVV